MGVAEDREPPLKRVKLVGESNSLLDNSCFSVDSSLGVSMALPLTSQGDVETVGAKGLIKKSEFVRLISRALYSLGYNKSGALLEQESGIQVHTSVVDLLMQKVNDGKWDESMVTLRKIGLPDETTVKSASFLLLEQKYFQLLEMEDVDAALQTLRKEIMPLRINTKRVHELASFLISPSNGSVKVDRSKVLEDLQNILPASVIIPEKRLECLVEQAVSVQRDACAFHNAFDTDLTLFKDHTCGRHKIPCKTIQVLEGHTDEVWFLQFSHDGKYLASASKDQSAIIWEVSKDGAVSPKHTLTHHQKPVLSVSWSPDDRQVLTCGQEEVVRRWDVESGECLQVYEKNGVGLISCGWFPDGKGIIGGLVDRSIVLWAIEGTELVCWNGQRTLRISDMAVTADTKRIISICKETTILLLDRESSDERMIEEEQTVTSFSLSSDNKFLLVNLTNQEIHLWSIEEGDPQLVSRYKGHKRNRFVIRSCFGGLEQGFIASGSEDSQVYIWHRITEELLLKLPGHSGAVNSVSWSPTNLHMLASASDDHTIRIWGLEGFKLKKQDHNNGRCNGTN